MIKTGAFGASAAALALLAAGGVEAKTAPDPIKAAFVVLGEDGATQARVVTRAKACPVIRLGAKRRLAMNVRAAPETVPLRTSISAPEDTKPSAFPVTVCEATIPADAKTA